MRIYDAEKKDGLEDGLRGSDGLGLASISAKVKKAILSPSDNILDRIKSVSAGVSNVEELIGFDQPDLALIVSVLASAGWNLNDDIFTTSELWAARGSAIHKPMNNMHDGNIILGHIVKSHAVDKFGNEIILDEGDPIPKDFDVEVAGVLYKALPERQELIKDILAKANEGEMFVSMECWFPDFAYGFLDPHTGETKIVERTESTAFLTKHLRAFNGAGEFQGNKIGRVLKNFVFGGQGFVSEPANPESVIKVAANKVAASRVFTNVDMKDISKGGVSSMDPKEIEAIQADLKKANENLEEAKAETVKVQSELDDIKANDFETKIGALQSKNEEVTAELSEANTQTETVQSEKVELQKKLDEAVAQSEKANSELEAIRKSIKAGERLAKMSEIREIEDKDKTLAELAEMTDETFDIVLKYAGEIKAKATNSDESDNDDKSDDDSGTEAKAALNDVEVKAEADFQVSEDVDSGDETAARALANTLTGNRNVKEGGE